jgi:pectate lyase
MNPRLFHLLFLLVGLSAADAPAGQIVNLSSRAVAFGGSDAVIAGFTVTGTASKKLLIRAAGPALTSLAVTGALAAVQLDLIKDGTILRTNLGWDSGVDGANVAAAAGGAGAFAFPAGSKDVAFVATLPPGGYTAIVSPAGGAAPGVVLVEVYDLDPAADSRLTNLSTRAKVGTGGDILIAGFNVAGTGTSRLLLRATGPALAGFGVGGALLDPRLDLYRATTPATLIAANDQWQDPTATATLNADVSRSVGAFALAAGSKDAAMVFDNASGGYTAQVSGVGGGTGVALVEIYEAPAPAPVTNLAAFNLTGFATVAPSTTGGGTITETDPAYVKVSTPLELANALLAASKATGAVKVIEITNDLDLGWNEIGSATQTLASSPFRAHSTPLLHPRLLVTGVSIIDIRPKGGLTIFSANGATIRHATFNLKGASDLIVRNLKFDELWEWDESTKGQYDRNDWDFIDLGNGGATTHVWIDHCTFTKSYDGIVDLKAGTQYVTISWCKYVGDDGATNPRSFVRQQIAALEANRAAYPFYNFLRTNGFSVEDIITIHQGHDKAHLMGSSALDPENATLNATFHHQWFSNLWDRCVPRLRAGNVHNYNLYVDDTGVLAARRLRDARAAALSPALQSTLNNTYSFNPPINGSISTEGGAVLVEKSVYLDCLSPLRNNQTDVTNPVYTGKIKALDTLYLFHNANGTITSVRGDSTDAGNPLGPFQAPVIPFSWSGFTTLPYAYTQDDPAALLAMLQTGAGAGVLTWSKANWLKTSY